jgi:hypothetical protein
MRTLDVTTLLTLTACQPASAEITRVWLTHRTTDPSKIVVNWETAAPGNSVVRYGLNQNYRERTQVKILVLHGWQSTPGGLKPTYL